MLCVEVKLLSRDKFLEFALILEWLSSQVIEEFEKCFLAEIQITKKNC